MSVSKKQYIKPKITIIAVGSPKHKEIIALLNAKDKKRQSNSNVDKQ